MTRLDEGFRAGVEPGGLTTDYEIKMLICYVLSELGRPMPISAMIETFVGEGLANYFETASAASGLVKSGHIAIETSEDNERCYHVTELGIGTAHTFEKNIPASVRDKAVSAARHYFVMKRRRAQNTVTVKRVQDGYLMTLTIADVGSDLLSMTILLPDEQSCDLVKRRFLNDPVVIYKGVVALLTGSYENVGALLEPAEDLPRG